MCPLGTPPTPVSRGWHSGGSSRLSRGCPRRLRELGAVSAFLREAGKALVRFCVSSRESACEMSLLGHPCLLSEIQLFVQTL